MVAVADRPLVAGSALAPGDLRFVPIEAGFEGLASLLGESSLGSYEGWIIERSLGEGELLELAALLEPGAPDGLRSMSIPVPIEHAAGGGLVAGDRIDVVSVVDGVANYVVTGIEVLTVADHEGGAFAAAGQYHLVVAVDSDQALALSSAMDSGGLEIVRSTGADTPAGSGGRDGP